MLWWNDSNIITKSYDALLDDLEKLRERNAELERKLDKEIKLSYEIERIYMIRLKSMTNSSMIWQKRKERQRRLMR